MNKAATERQSSQSSIRLLQILECIAKSRTPMRLQDLSQQVDMTEPTVLRYLYALQSAGYIYQEENTNRYALTWRICRLTDNLNSLLGLRNITNYFVNHLANTLSLGTCLVVRNGNECLYLDCIDNPNSSTLQRIGKKAPLHTTGSGKVLLSQFSDAQLEDYYRASGSIKYTEHTITDLEQLRAELMTIRQQDFAMDEEECEIGLRCISCPLRSYSGQVIAAISVFGNVFDMTNERIESEIYPALKKAASTISFRLGYSET